VTVTGGRAGSDRPPQELPRSHSDLEIRAYVKKKLQFAAVAKIVIERAWIRFA